jgi:hypothetical protein
LCFVWKSPVLPYLKQKSPKISIRKFIIQKQQQMEPTFLLHYVHKSNIFQENFRLVSNRKFLGAIVRIGVQNINYKDRYFQRRVELLLKVQEN